MYKQTQPQLQPLEKRHTFAVNLRKEKKKSLLM